MTDEQPVVFPIELEMTMVHETGLSITVTIFITAGSRFGKRWLYQIHSESSEGEDIHWADHDGWSFSLFGAITAAREESLKVLEHVIARHARGLVR